MVAKAIKGQQTFVSLGLADLRYLDAEHRRDADEIDAAESFEDAVRVLEAHVGFNSDGMESLTKSTPIGDVCIERSNLSHIVEKRPDARERYVKLALDTLEFPYEIWRSEYDDGTERYMFIGAYCRRQQMLVIVAPWNGKVLWNFMHCEAKSLNKHRCGNLVYARYQ